ncbi:MAG: aldehyde ferredoxin oxidoreductase N-terminal domain-containing protein, partial [Candidatus Methanomethylicia archaeon]
MKYGYHGRILRVNLSTREIKVEEVPEEIFRMYLGGRGLGAYILFKELKPKIDPLLPENKLIFAVSIITGAPIPGVNRISVVSKSPLTNTYGEAEAGGFFAPELKFSGFEAIVIEGKAEEPVYLWVKDGNAELRNANHIWGKTVKETIENIKSELKEPRARVACIGPAGEKIVKFANIMFDNRYAAGRSGLGAVMGS